MFRRAIDRAHVIWVRFGPLADVITIAGGALYMLAYLLGA
jgi:hypothetical protein